jgi:glycolate oxidase FAD binding subunit
MTTLRSVTRQLFERLRDETADVDADFVVAPTSLDETAAVLAAAAEVEIPTTFLGGGTHVGYGNAVAADLVVTSAGLNRIIDWRPDDLTVIVQAGVPIDTLEAEIASRNQTAVFPEIASGATVGGVVAAGLCGSPVVKSSTGYGVPRLATGSFGTLGMIGEVMLKLWSRPMATATGEVSNAAEAYAETYRPLAALETSEGSFLYLGGPDTQITSQARAVGAEPEPGLAWPEPVNAAIRLEFRVPARFIRPAIDRAKRLGATRWIAEHGVGRVEAGVGAIDPKSFAAARAWAESTGGALVVVATGDAGVDPWGTPPVSIEIQRRIKSAFDPSGICNPGIMPGGV